jgi:hypothetical protein
MIAWLINPPSSGTLAFSLRLVPSIPAADSPAFHTSSSASLSLVHSQFPGTSSAAFPPYRLLRQPLVPGSAMERGSSVCIRFEQLWAPQRDAEAMATRHQIRSRLVEILNKIQQVSGVDNAPFVATDVSYIS